MSQVLEVIADKLQALQGAQKPEDMALLKTDIPDPSAFDRGVSAQ